MENTLLKIAAEAVRSSLGPASLKTSSKPSFHKALDLRTYCYAIEKTERNKNRRVSGVLLVVVALALEEALCRDTPAAAKTS